MAVKKKEEMVRERMDECAELVAAELFPAVRPVYRTKRGLPEHSATCTLLEIQGNKYLITAAHVIDDNEHSSPLLVGGVGPYTVPRSTARSGQQTNPRTTATEIIMTLLSGKCRKTS
jgi:hypothetical protein